MFKFVLLVLAVIAMASAQYIASPYYRTAGYGHAAYPYAAATPYAYGGLGYSGAYYG